MQLAYGGPPLQPLQRGNFVTSGHCASSSSWMKAAITKDSPHPICSENDWDCFIKI